MLVCLEFRLQLAIPNLIEMSFTLTKKQLFRAIKDKEAGLHPTVKVNEPRFAACAEEAFFALAGKDKENLSPEDSAVVSKFLYDFVKKIREYWREGNVKSNPEIMYKNHMVYFDKPFSFGELNPPDPVFVVEAIMRPPDPPVADQVQPMEIVENGKVIYVAGVSIQLK